MFEEEIKQHLTNHLIPFWQKLKDKENGGFYGWVGYDLHLDKKAVKGCILNSRILWFFSNAFMLLKDEELRVSADYAFSFMKDYCIDRKYGGVYWSVRYNGVPEDMTKYTYNQAFAIYALSSYYAATGNHRALELVWELYNLVEEKCTDKYGYMEAFSCAFEPEDNDKLSENGVIAKKTMNTLLHVLEAYTELYRVTKEEKVADRIRYLLDLLVDKIYNKDAGRQEVFFDKTWNSLIDLYSYGHDIETSWLADRSLEILDDSEYIKKVRPITKAITENIYHRAYMDHSLVYEAENGVVDATRVWWVQAEAVVGFLNGYQKSPGEKKYLEAAEDIWKYIAEYFIDKREGSEWFWSLDQNRKPLEKPIVEPWKCPYHNGRMCFEVIRRMQDVT